MSALHVNSPKVKYSDGAIEADYTYSTSKVLNKDGFVTVSNFAENNFPLW